MAFVRDAIRYFTLAFISVLLVSCSGGGEDGTAGMPSQEDIAASSGDNEGSDDVATSSDNETNKVIISGTITYDRIPFEDSFYGGLDYPSTTQQPARGVVIKALDGSNSEIASTVTSATGEYSVTVDRNTDIKIRVVAQMASSSPTWDITVRDNTQGGSGYVMDGSLVSSGTGAGQIRNLHAASGWNGSQYTNTRSAGPFAILDSIYDSVQVLVGADANLELPELTVFWSEDNIAVGGAHSQGFIGSSFYSTGSGSIYILGKADNDSDEFDRAVIQHEFAHYVEDKLSRSESIGGSHNLDSRLDMRVAFGEAWGNAFAGISSGDPVYRDSFGDEQQFGFSFDVENNVVYSPGWFSERSLQAIIYDIYDSTSDGDDDISLGFGPIYDALRSSAYLSFSGMTSIYPFIELIKQANPSAEASINDMLSAQDIYGTGMYGDGETNDAGTPIILPIYQSISVGESTTVCSGNNFKEYNGVDVNRFVLLSIAQAGRYTMTAQKSSSSTLVLTNPQLELYLNGNYVAASRSSTANVEALSRNLEVGTYLLQVNESTNSDNFGTTGGTACYDVSLNL